LFFFVAPVSTRVDANGWEFTSFAPAFDSKRGDTKNFGNFPDSEEVGEVIEIQVFILAFFGGRGGSRNRLSGVGWS